MPFKGVDFYRIDDLLSDEERMVRDTVRRFVDERVIPVIDKHFEEATFPEELIPEMAQMGLFGGNLPEEYGCANMNNVACALVMYPIFAFGSEEQKRKWLPLLAKGEKIGCFGLTEPDHGSDPGGMETRARRADKGWVLNGTKRWITNGTIADVAIVWAKVDDGITGFIVEKGTPGFTTSDIHGKFSMRASITSELVFEDVRLEARNHLP